LNGKQILKFETPQYIIINDPSYYIIFLLMTKYLTDKIFIVKTINKSIRATALVGFEDFCVGGLEVGDELE
jgi:hypothetical protein